MLQNIVYENIKKQGKKEKKISKEIFSHQTHKDTHRENAPPNKSPAPTKSTNMSIWVVGTSNHLFKRGS